SEANRVYACTRRKVGRGIVIELAGGLFLIAVVTLGGLLLQTSRKLHQARLACARFEGDRDAAVALLDTVPLAVFRWQRGRQDDELAVRGAPYRQFLARFDSENAAQVEAARQALHRRGPPFSV